MENGEHKSVIAFFDVSDPSNVTEVNPAVRMRRDFHDAGSVGVTNFTVDGKDLWVLCAYDNGSTDVYVTDAFPAGFKQVFSATLEETEFQSLCLVTDAANNVFAVGFHRTQAGRDMATLFAVDLANAKVSVVTERHFRATGTDDLVGGGPHFRWGAGVEVISATELALFCTGRRYGSGVHINAFDSARLSVRTVARVVRSKPTAAATHRASRAAHARKARRRPARRR